MELNLFVNFFFFKIHQSWGEGKSTQIMIDPTIDTITFRLHYNDGPTSVSQIQTRYRVPICFVFFNMFYIVLRLETNKDNK